MLTENYEEFTENQRKILEKYVSDVDTHVFVIRNLPEVIKGALFSRYSRSTLGLRSLLLKEFITHSEESAFTEIAGCAPNGEENSAQEQIAAIQKAQNFYDRILDGYGDDSIGELGGAHLAIENISMLGAKIIEDSSNKVINYIKEKPSALIQFLTGDTLESSTIDQCTVIGAALAKLHLAAFDFDYRHPNARGNEWRDNVANELRDVVSKEDWQLIEDELSFQRLNQGDTLPKGIIHADLFMDNVLFDGDQLTGIIDFYYACYDDFILDIATTVNDWCIDADGTLNSNKYESLLNSYHDIRKISSAEIESFPLTLRRAALRFWLSRLYDFHFPKEGLDVLIKDPDDFKKILLLWRNRY